MTIQPFKLHVSQDVLDDLQDRLAHTRWPDEVESAGWDYGTNLGYMKKMVDYWQHSYDWRKQEAALNAFAQFSATIDGQEIQFIHVRGKGPNPTPILLLHGWPDSIYRYIKLIPLLTDPAAHGGDANDSFDVIVPNLLDTTRSPKKHAQGQKWRKLGEKLWRLMTEKLGYTRFGAAGGDGGSPLAQSIALDHPDSVIGLHLTDLGYHMTQGQHENLSETEQAYMQAVEASGYSEGAYGMMLGTKPQTYAYGLNDSPVGWAALIIEKFRSWSDCNGDVESVYSKDDLLNNIMLNWIQGFDPRGYREEWLAGSLEATQKIDVPAGFAISPRDPGPVPPREFGERNFPQMKRWTVLSRGGHFVALEDPTSLANEMRAFFRDLR